MMDEKNTATLSLEFVPLSVDCVRNLKNLNASICPTTLADSFYSDLLKSPNRYPCTAIVLSAGGVAGGMICKLEDGSQASAGRNLYIISFGVYLRFRRAKIGTAMMKRLIAWCEKEAVSSVSLHVHVGNEDAISFYKRFGFQVSATVPNYYRRLTPKDAYELRKTIAQ